jgi:hypothetical protein
MTVYSEMTKMPYSAWDMFNSLAAALQYTLPSDEMKHKI